MPDDPDALHLLGLCTHAQGNADHAVTLIGQALAVRETARSRCNYGMVLLSAGRPEAARAACARALALRPEYPEALINLGAALEALGRLLEAVDAFSRAISLDASRAEAWLNLGNTLHLLGRTTESQAAYSQAVLLSPAMPQSQTFVQRELGGARLGSGCSSEMEASPDTRLSPVDDDDHELTVDIAETVLLPSVIAQAPASPQFSLNLATALRQLGRLEEAVAAYRQVLAIQPDYGDALGNLASLLGETGRLSEAEALQRRAVATKPSTVAAYNDLAVTLTDEGRLNDALAVLDVAAALDSVDPYTRQNRAFVLFLLGRMREGWDAFEARFETKLGRGDHREFRQPTWTGENLGGRTILLHAEQGLGDTIQFCRYVPMVEARGGRVLLEVQRPLKRLMESLTGVSQLLSRGDTLSGFDLHCPLLSLPRAFSTTLDAIPPPAQLRPSPHVVTSWVARLPEAGIRRVGIVWAGNPRHLRDRRRSIPFAELAPLWTVPDVCWHSLQVGARTADLKFAPPGLVDDLSPVLADFADTAAALKCMDLVITCDTATAHLSGSIGVPTFVMLPQAPDWRWLQGRADSPWYPSMRLFRQAAPSGWATLLAQVVEALRAFVST